MSTPEEIYRAALEERASINPLDQRQACEKGWLAVTEAVDKFLALKGRFVKRGDAEAHAERNKFLADLVDVDPNAKRIAELVSQIADQLHGTCFYAGYDSPAYDGLLRDGVREVLELTGFWDGSEG